MAHTTDMLLADARTLIARAIDKAEEIGMRGGIAVVGASGALVSASRMDHGGAGGMARARSKAWIAATQQIPSLEHLTRMRTLPPPMSAGFSALSPEAIFPGAGGMPIRAAGPDGSAGPVIAGIAASGAGIGPFVDYTGAVREKLIADGRPANGEDLLVHYALGIPYAGQHGDDLERWQQAYGAFPADAGPGLGMAPAPPAARQHEHEWALAVADRAIAQARAHGVRIAVAVVDRRGDPIQQDCMDGAVAAAPEVAQAVAATAATFGAPSDAVGEHYERAGVLDRLAALLQWPLLPVPGGQPIDKDGLVVAGLGIAGPPPTLCAQIAAAVIAVA